MSEQLLEAIIQLFALLARLDGVGEKERQKILKLLESRLNKEVIDHYMELFDRFCTEDLPEEKGPGEVEIIEFKGPLGKMKLERTTQPLVIDKKTIGSRRIGSDTAVEYIYSETEKVHKFTAYRFDPNSDNWVEMKMERDEMIF